MASSSRHNDVADIIFRELQSINDEYDHPFTQKQVDIIVKFISTDYDDRCVRVRPDIASRYFDNVPQFLAFGYLNQLLEKLGQNTPLSMVEKHVDIFSFLIQELKGYFVGAAWLDKMEALVRDNKTYAKELETNEKYLKELFNDHLKSIKEEKEKMLGELQVRKAQLNCSVEGSDQAFAEYLQNSEIIKGIFEKEIMDVEATIMEILSEVKPELGREAKAKLASLEFDIFSPTIIREKKVITSSTFVSDNSARLDKIKRKILTPTSPSQHRRSSVSNSMATSSNHNEVEQIIYCELQSINEEYDHPFTQKQVEIIVKFISIDYDDRWVRVQPDIASRYFDSIPQFLAFGYLNQLLEKLGQNTPLSMVEKHVDIFSFLIRELKGYFVGAAWLDKMEALVRDNEIYAKELEMTDKNLKEIFNDCLKSIKEEKEKMLGKLQVRKAQLNCSVEEGSDEAFAEYLQNSEMIKGVFEKEINDVEATIMEILPEMKPELGHEAKAKLASLEFDIFSPTIIREKKVITSSTFISDNSARLEKINRKILTLTSPYQRRRSSVSNSMATSSSHNEVEEIIYRELQSINDEYDHPFSQKQVDIIVKFISTDYDDRCVHVRSDIVSRYFDNISKFLAFGYLNQLLEKLGQNTPLSMVEKHVDIFSFLIRELKGYFVGAAWLDKMEALVRDNEIYAKELETTEKNLKEIFNDCLKSIKEEKEKMLGKLQVRKARLNCSVEEGSDRGFAEYLQNSEMIKSVFEKEINDVEATIMEILPEMKPELGREAKAKLASLEFDIFSPTIIREKKVVTSSKFVSDNAAWLENKRRKILTMRRGSSVSNSIATSSSHNEVKEIIYRELQSINDEYVHPFTPNQVDNIVKFISTDYDDRCVRVQSDIASRYLDNIPQFLAFGYLNHLLEKLGQNSPLSMIEKHVFIFSFLIQELKGYFVGAAWLDKMETLVRDNETYAKELEMTEKDLKEIFNDRLKSIKEEKEKMLGELQVRKAQLNCSMEEGSDQAFTEYLQNSEMIKGVFEKEIKDVQATVMEIMSEMKPALDKGAKAKLGSLEFDIFSPTIIREKKVTRSTSKSSEKAAWLEMLDNY